MFGSFPPTFQAGKGVTYIRVAWNYKSATYSLVPNCFHFVLGYRLAKKSAQTYEKLYFSIFNSLGLFPLGFGQVKEWLKLNFTK